MEIPCFPRKLASDLKTRMGFYIYISSLRSGYKNIDWNCLLESLP